MSDGTILFLVLLLLASAAVAVFYTYGRYGRRLRGEPSEALQPLGDATEIDRAIAPKLAAHPGESGIALLSDNVEAFATRALSARKAGRSLDLQYYFWKHDLTGQLLMREIIAAADRGVRVRLLLDDINAGVHDRMCIALDSHPNIEVRLFNPSRARSDRLRRGVEMIFRAFSVTRRMHNKAWIADGHIAIAGGRNVGDAYFDAAELSNFRDLDTWMVGPVVAQAAAIFDSFWNSAVVAPIGELRSPRKDYLPRLRRKLERTFASEGAGRYMAHVEEKLRTGDALQPSDRLHWSSGARVVSDPPEKAHLQRRQNWMLREILPVLLGARERLRIISPYFIPGKEGVKAFSELAARNVSVEVLTNSLAATDVAAVHGAYASYRRRLMRHGITLFELKDGQEGSDSKRISLFGSRGASLHTKAFAVDRSAGFIGSMNFDPRSRSLNTEMGVVFTHQALVDDLIRLFDAETAPEFCFRLSMKNGLVRWQDEVDGKRRVLRHEPEAGFIRRLTAFVIRFPPIESQL